MKEETEKEKSFKEKVRDLKESEEYKKASPIMQKEFLLALHIKSRLSI